MHLPIHPPTILYPPFPLSGRSYSRSRSRSRSGDRNKDASSSGGRKSSSGGGGEGEKTDGKKEGKEKEAEGAIKRITLKEVLTANPGITMPDAIARLNAYNTGRYICLIIAVLYHSIIIPIIS